MGLYFRKIHGGIGQLAELRKTPFLLGTEREQGYRSICLRTVIVTAAVYWGFNSELSLLLLTFQHRAGVSPYTSSFDLAQTCVFAKQSPGPILCGSLLHEHPFSLSYGVNLPSSLTTLLPLALEFSSYLPVSVCGTGT